MKVVKSISSVLTDITNEVSDYYAGTSTINLTTTDYLYIGQNLPFNHLYFKPGTPNAAVVSIDHIAIWDGATWNNCASVNDETKVSTSTLAQAGFISWVPRKDKLWKMDDTVYIGSDDQEFITGLGSLIIYDQYWVRIKYTGTLMTGTSLVWLGNIFSNDNELSTEFPDLLRTNTMTAYKAAKSGWEEQAVRAAYVIEQDIQNMGKIIGIGQILDRSKLMSASIYKVAEIAYAAFGQDYLDQKNEARKEYVSRLTAGLQGIDQNLDGIENPNEKPINFRARFLSR